MKKIVKAAVTGEKSDKILGSISAADLLEKVQSQIVKLNPNCFLESCLTKSSSVVESRASDKNQLMNCDSETRQHDIFSPETTVSSMTAAENLSTEVLNQKDD